MKKLLRFTLVSAIAALLFTSCNKDTSLSVTKRHYRDGYHVEWNTASHKPVKESRKNKNIAQLDKRQQQTQGISTENRTYKKPGKNKEQVTRTPDPALTFDKKTTSKTENKESGKTSRFITPEKMLNHTPFVRDSQLSERIMKNNGNNGLIWTIVIILLILWIIGFWGGYYFGGLLHLLLVIILVIIILKLLGVI